MERLPTQDEFLSSLHRMRGEAVGFLEKARANGAKNEIRRWGALARKCEKLIIRAGGRVEPQRS
jgi:hypothetical protein